MVNSPLDSHDCLLKTKAENKPSLDQLKCFFEDISGLGSRTQDHKDLKNKVLFQSATSRSYHGINLISNIT